MVISNCYTLGSISVTSSAYGVGGHTGGIIGRGTGTTVQNCVALQSALSNTQYVNSISPAISTSTNNYANSTMSLTGTVVGSAGTSVTLAKM